ncbi:MAG: 16S rRNA (guanine(966)-N(2))-methyltransferase RsmD [Planctomycetes bacterium]|nr:16S rRNA (guanine(966)-N(2))-methyltransferase RsmD [Planctomycetota bacterium]
MSVRIIAGDWKNRNIDCPPGKHTRPLLNRIKQSLFDYLGQFFDGQRVIDICAGSGSFGFEAASRHAAEVHLIDNDATAVQCMQKNAETLKALDCCTIHNAPFQHVLPNLKNCDLIFADPPFPWYAEQAELLSELLVLAADSLAADGRFVIRGEKGQNLPALPSSLTCTDQRKYGRSWVMVLRLTATNNGQ